MLKCWDQTRDDPTKHGLQNLPSEDVGTGTRTDNMTDVYT